MFSPIPPFYKLPFWLIVLCILFVTWAAGWAAVSFLQNKEVGYAATAVALLGALLALVQWIVGQLREAARTRWEAVRTYYAEGDSKELIDSRASIFAEEDFNKANVFCNFYEKWGRLVVMSYLPVEVFNGPSGVSISNAAIKLEPFLKTQRESNARYAESYLRLVDLIQRKGYLAGTAADTKIPELLARLNKRRASARPLVKAMKYVGLLLLAAILLYVFLVSFSSTTSRFACAGKLTSTGGTQPATIYMKLEDYRWWVGLWSKADANVHLEIPNTWLDYFGHVVKVGDQFQIFDSQKNLKGDYSLLSKALAVKTPEGIFVGTCSRND
jgi:hypothetical protein